MEQSEGLQEFKGAQDAGMMEYNGKKEKKLGLLSNRFICFGPDKGSYQALLIKLWCKELFSNSAFSQKKILLGRATLTPHGDKTETLKT